MLFRSIASAVVAATMVPAASAAFVLSHFMVMNSYAYNVNQWKTDMQVALDIGIDGFALNWVPPNCNDGIAWTVDRIDDAFTAAEEVGFKLVHSFDMSYSECYTYWNTTFMQHIIEKNAGSSANYRWNNNILVTTYGGDSVDQYGDGFFSSLKKNLAYNNNAITLAPALTQYSMAAYGSDDPQSHAKQTFDDFSSADGFFNWQSWPLDSDQNMTSTADHAFQSALKTAGRTGPYIMGVSPWQYKDLDNGNKMDSWVQYSDTLFPHRFSQLTTSEIQPDIIEIQTWNDFCESHYLRDLPSKDITAKDYVELGNMGAYVWGQEHSAWRIMAKYYLTWWKTGSAPAIEKDQVVFWYRIHPKDALCLAGSSAPIRNADFVEDAVFAWALVSSAATISMSLGSNKYYTFTADGFGPSMGQVPFPSSLDNFGMSVTPEISIVRNGAVQQVQKGDVAISRDCAYQNFNPVVGIVGDTSDL